MEKVILYYKFVPVTDPTSVMFWQRNLCERLGLKGRIIIAEQGINGTLGGPIASVKAYVKEMKQHPLFKGAEFKWSDGSAGDFPKLSVKVRSELVTLAPDEKFDVFNSTKGLRPQKWHDYLKKNPDVVVLDARNEYESDIGAFRAKNVIKPKIKAFKQIKEVLKDIPKDQTVLTYCTGDVRCEYLSAYMNHKGFKDVYHLDGGIVKYGEEFKDEGYWDGKCYVFDKRMNVQFSEKSKDVGACNRCNKATSDQINCTEKDCNRQILMCQECATKYSSCVRHSPARVAKSSS